jgi:imidazolonepropionase-like amidohydrolase
VANVPAFGVTYGGLRGEDYWYQMSDVWRHPLLSRFVPPNELRARAVRRLLAPIAEYHHKRSATVAKLLADRGVAVSIGAHGQREGLASHWEMWTFRLGGMSAVAALRAATIVPATSLGLQNDLGSLEPGKLADIVVIEGIIDDENFQTDRVSMVMLNGRLYEAHTLNETRTGSHRTRPFFWSAGTDPAVDQEAMQW